MVRIDLHLKMRCLKIQYAILPIKFKFINKFVFILPVKQPAQ